MKTGIALLLGLIVGVCMDSHLMGKHRDSQITALQVTQCMKADKR